jgi:deoxycytidine triphosphate deaminase
MPLSPLVRQLQQVPLTREVLARSERPERLRLGGAGRAGRALITSALARVAEAPLLVVVPTLEEAGRMAALLELMGWQSCQLYPTSEGSPYEPFDPTSEITWGQLQVLADLLDPEAGGKRLAIVATERALQPHLPPPDVLAGRCLTLRRGELLLDPGEFYILASSDDVEIPVDQAAEMTPIDPSVGEFRVHYAGFFDPGFGTDEAHGAGSKGVLEVRTHDTPFLLEHGQIVARLVYEPLTQRPTRLYGEGGSHYQRQGLKLSKHFRPWG